MEWLLFALLVWFFLARGQKKRAKKAFEKSKQKFAAQQKRYDEYMHSLPGLIGDGSFSQEVAGERAYKETIDLFGHYLKDYHPGENEFFALVELEPDNPFDENAVRVETGQATIGYIPRSEAKEFGNELKQLGGRARCIATLYWSPEDGMSSVRLDISRPLRAEG